MCTKEQEKQIQERFDKAYAVRFGSDDIDWKDTGRARLAYLNWAVAWRTLRQIYPDAKYRVIETSDFSPLWNVNGYGMIKVSMSTDGIEFVETFPIMDNRNESKKVEAIDARDINDAIQRALTKLAARFGVGLYIYEGKLDGDGPKQAQSPYRDAPAQPKPTGTTLKASDPASQKQIGYLNKLMGDKACTAEHFAQAFGKLPTEMNAGEARNAIDTLKSWPDAKEAEDDLPF